MICKINRGKARSIVHAPSVNHDEILGGTTNRRFAALEAEQRGPMRTEADVADARKKLSQIEAENNELRVQIDEAVDRDTRLAAFRQTVMLASGKLRKLEEDLETLQAERAKVAWHDMKRQHVNTP